MSKIFVTGGTGFIGSHLIRYLCSQGHSIRALCRPSSPKDILSDCQVDFMLGDLSDVHFLQQALKDCDYVFHLAGYAQSWSQDPDRYYQVNVQGTHNVLEAAEKVGIKKVVVTSTCMTFGPSDSKPKKESDKRTENFFCNYESTKYIAERVVDYYVKRGLSVVTVNPTRVFGPGRLSEANSVTKMIDLYLQGKWRLILSDGKAVGNYVFVDDVVQGHWQALIKGTPGEKYILSGANLSFNRFFKELADIAHCRRRMIHIPLKFAFFAAEFCAFLARRFKIYPLITPEWVKIFAVDWAFSHKKAEAQLDYIATPFQEAVQRTLTWIKEQGTAIKEA